MSKLYLKNIYINSFGKFKDKTIGDFKPGLNIVYGKNEAGKSTIFNFIKGVLCGWPTKNVAKKQINTYGSSRSGQLVFDGEETVVVKRDKTIGNNNLIKVPEKESFETMYCLTQDTLWDLGKNEKQISSKFLAAETGTNKTPADVLNQTETELKAFESKNKTLQDKSIVYCEEQIKYYNELISSEYERLEKIENANIKDSTAEQEKARELQGEINQLQNLKGKAEVYEQKSKFWPVVLGIIVGLLFVLAGLFIEQILLYIGIAIAVLSVILFFIKLKKTPKTKVTDIEKKIAKKQQELDILNSKIKDIDRARIENEAIRRAPSSLKQLEAELSIWEDKKAQLIDEYFVVLARKEILVNAIKDWDQNKQPQFYEDASRFLSIITNGEWTKVFIADNQMYVTGKDTLTPDVLSLSTRQQLYLALRIAILIRPESEGTNIPVLCDDILVNFDDERKQGAINALKELAKYRQVIMFTHTKYDLDNVVML